MKRSWGWTLFAALGLLSCLVVYVLATAPQPASTATMAEAAVVPAATMTDVGAPRVGRTAFEFTARIDQQGGRFDIHGYVTYLHNLDTQLLFTDPITHSEATARITISGTTNLTSRSILSNVFNVDSVGTITFYFDEDEGASFDDLDSFARGTAIGTANAQLQNILTVTGPDTGIANGGGELLHTAATPFTLDGTEYRLGRPGLVERVNFTGGGVRFVPEPPVAIIAIGGNGMVVGFDTFVPQAEKNSP